MNDLKPAVGTILDKGPRRGAWQLLNTVFGPLLALVAVYLIFAALDFARPNGGSFTKWTNFQAMAAHAADVAVAALGMTIIIIAGGIDLSMGAAVALAATTTAWAFLQGYPLVAALLVGIATGGLAGAVNGVLISSLRLVPFIVTLGTMMIFQGAARWLSGDTPIRPPPASVDWTKTFNVPYAEPWWLFVAPGVWLMFGLAVLVAIFLRYSVFARHIFAVGSNEATARLCGINVTATRIAVYTLGGLLAGIAGIYQFSLLSEGSHTAGKGMELHYIAAVVIGGGSLSGGRGSVLGTVSGAAIVIVIRTGCAIIGVDDMYQDIIIGLIIIAAVALDQWRQKRFAAD